MASGTRISGAALLAGVVLLVGSIGGTAYFLQKRTPPSVVGPSIAELDIVCSGRVDSEGLVIGLDPALPGRVVKVLVRENTPVKKDDAIVELDDTSYRIGLKEADAAIAAVQAAIAAAESGIAQHPTRIVLQEKKVAAARAEVAAGEEQLAQLKRQLSLSGQITQADYDAAAAKLKGGALLADAEAVQLDQLRTLDVTLELKAATAKLASAQATRERAKTAIDNCTLRAPADGTILRLQTAPGATLSPGHPIPQIVFVPAGAYIVRAELEQGSLGQVKVGMPATIRDDSRAESPVWKGRVKEIAGWVAQRRLLVLEPGELNDVRTTEAIIELEPNSERLWIGQRMQVRLIPNPN